MMEMILIWAFLSKEFMKVLSPMRGIRRSGWPESKKRPLLARQSCLIDWSPYLSPCIIQCIDAVVKINDYSACLYVPFSIKYGAKLTTAA